MARKKMDYNPIFTLIAGVCLLISGGLNLLALEPGEPSTKGFLLLGFGTVFAAVGLLYKIRS